MNQGSSSSVLGWCTLGLAVAALILAPAATVSAQETSSITGVVSDNTGSVLPGATVVVASPALIEGSRTVVADGSGTYRHIALRPGTYDVTASLDGFSTVVLEGIELTGTFTATVDIELSVGDIAETVTVVGASPTVDVQTTQRQAVLTREVVDALPTGRVAGALGILVPAVETDASALPNVGGTNMVGARQRQMAHGSDLNDYRVQVDGFHAGSPSSPGYAMWIPNFGASTEVNINVNQAGSAESPVNGVSLNMISQEGGNSFAGSFFGTGATDDWQSDNFSQRVQDLGLETPTTLVNSFDLNLSYGGPLVRDRLWFFASARHLGAQRAPGGVFANQNAGIRDNWRYVADPSSPAVDVTYNRAYQVSLTWQATERNKFTFRHESQNVCLCRQVGLLSGFSNNTGWQTTPEAAPDTDSPEYRWTAGTWTAPLTNRVLLQGGVLFRTQFTQLPGRPDEGDPRLDLIPVWDVGRGLVYHGMNGVFARPYVSTDSRNDQARFSVSYVTGSHSIRVGTNMVFPYYNQLNRDNNYNLTYMFFNGFPIRFFQRASPWTLEQSGMQLGLYAQDTWTIDRLTLNLGIRFDRYATSYPQHEFGPSVVLPDRNFTTPGGDWHGLNDISPKLGVAYDLFGNGRTALKVSAVRALTNPVFLNTSNPAATVLNSQSRQWVDLNRNFTVDCDLANTGAQNPRTGARDICGAIPANFGQAGSAADVAEDTYRGWQNTNYNWEFTAGIEHALRDNVGINFGYFRRIYGNFIVTQNRATPLSDFDQFYVTAPTDSRLPGGGGYEVGPVVDIKQDATGRAVDNLTTFASAFGTQTRHWNGFDLTVDARLDNGLIVAGGMSTGRASSNACDTAAATPVFNAPDSLLFCDNTEAFLTRVKAYATYQIPTIEVNLAAAFQSLPGPEVLANVPYSSAQIAQLIGRPLSNNARQIEVPVIAPGTVYGDRINQLDFRIGKVFNLDRARFTVNLDLHNALNTDAILELSQDYGANGDQFMDARSMIQGRVTQISLLVDF